MYTWRIDPNGLVIVSDDGGPEFTPTLTGKLAERCEAGIAAWGDKFRAWGMGVRYEWLIAMALQESNFNPNAFRQERNKDGTPRRDKNGRLLTGVGTFQITDPGLKGSHTDEQLKDPQLNTTIAAKHILTLVAKYGNRFPENSAAYNAGSVHKPLPGFENKWNMHCWHGHLDVEVPALNYTILRGLEDHQRDVDAAAHDEAEKAFGKRFGLLDLVNAHSAIEDDDDVPPVVNDA